MQGRASPLASIQAGSSALHLASWSFLEPLPHPMASHHCHANAMLLNAPQLSPLTRELGAPEPFEASGAPGGGGGGATGAPAMLTR